MAGELEIFKILRQVIDMGSFTALWYWIVVAMVWSSSSHFVMGVPYDMLIRARRHGGQAVQDFELMVQLSARRITGYMDVGGPWFLGVFAFIISMLATLGFWYEREFAQAMFFLMAPLTTVGFLSVAAARRVQREALRGEAIFALMRRTRFWIQINGMLAIAATSAWGFSHLLVAMKFFL